MLQHEYSHIFTKFHLQRSLKNNDFSPRGAELAIRGAALEERWRVPHAVTAAAWAAGPPRVGGKDPPPAELGRDSSGGWLFSDVWG